MKIQPLTQYDETTADRVRELLIQLSRSGKDRGEIPKSWFDDIIKSDFHDLLVALDDDGKIIAAVITAEAMAQYGAQSKHLEGIVQQLRDTTGVEVAVFLYELEDGDFKGSTRATGDVDLTAITGVYGGGGHKKAAGFSVNTKEPWSIIAEIVDMIEEQCKQLGIN